MAHPNGVAPLTSAFGEQRSILQVNKTPLFRASHLLCEDCVKMILLLFSAKIPNSVRTCTNRS